ADDAWPVQPIAPPTIEAGAPSFESSSGLPSTIPAASATRVVQSSGLDPALVSVLTPGAAVAEQYRALRTRLATSDQGSASSIILVTSPGRGEGKTLTAAHLAPATAPDCQTRIRSAL